MKKTLLTFATLAALLAPTASAQKKVAKETVMKTTADGMATTTSHYLYNTDGALVLKFTEGAQEVVYTPNADGLTAEEKTYKFDDNQPNKLKGPSDWIRYTYTADGKKATEEKLNSNGTVNQAITYSYDAKGNLSQQLLTTSNGWAVPIQYTNLYGKTGTLDSTHVVNVMQGRTMQKYAYTYAGSQLVKEELLTPDGTVTSTTEYEYNADGLLAQKVENASGATTITAYAYADIAAANTPLSLGATAAAGNTVTLAWTAPAAGADKYYVFYDNVLAEASETTFTTPVLKDGDHTFYVASVRGGVAANAAKVSAKVEDNSRVGVADVALNGDITSEEVGGKTIFNIPVKWTLPEGAQPESYRIYYNAQYYVDVEDGTLTSYVIPARNMKGWSMATNSEYVLDTEITVYAVYPTGNAEPANTVKIDPSPVTAIGTPAAGAEAAQVYSIGGARVADDGSADAIGRLPKGAYILRTGKTARKVLVK